MRLAAAEEVVFPDIIGVFKSLLNIAPLDMACYVDVSLNAFMDRRRFFLHCFHRLVNCGKDFIIYFDKIKGRLCDLFSHCCDCCDRLADITDFLYGKDLLIAEFLITPPDTLFDPQSVFACHYSFYAGKRKGLACIDIEDLRVRMRAPQDFSIEHTGQLYIKGIRCPAGDLLNPVYIDERVY